MSYVLKGDPSAQLVAKWPSYNAETKTYIETEEYRGTETAIRGLELQFQNAGLSYRITHDGPVWSMQVEIPQQEVDENLDRWEVFTESTEKSLFELPDAVEEAEVWDAAAADPDSLFSSYKKTIEDLVDEPGGQNFSSVDWPVGNAIVKHLRAGVTGWQLDLVVLRRTRRVQQQVAPNYQITLDNGLLVYTTAQLNLPPEVYFAVPTAPTVDPSVTIYRWGWRKRSQRVEIVGSFVEQTVELVFAPWSTLAYDDASSNLAW